MILLDMGGTMWSSEQLAAQLERGGWMPANEPW